MNPELKKVLKHLLMPTISRFRIYSYYRKGQIPWSRGYGEARRIEIEKNIYSDEIRSSFEKKKLPVGFGYRMDERVVEYPWIISNLSERKTSLLDAGSTFNYEYLLKHPRIANKNLTIYTYYPENESFPEKRINYVYGDLRELPFKENNFDQIICQSTIEHIDMDNSMYGYEMKNQAGSSVKSYEYMKVIEELYRVLKKGGILLLTFPFGKFENHGFFQQFDSEMLNRITSFLEVKGILQDQFFQYSIEGWKVSSKEESNTAESYNPHTGIGKKDDHAAHSRAICCLRFEKS